MSNVQVRHVWAGTAARTMSQAFIHPIDTIKTRMQVQLQIEGMFVSLSGHF